MGIILFWHAPKLKSHLEANISSNSLYSVPFGFALKSVDVDADELPLLLFFHKPLHLDLLVEGSLMLVVLFRSLLKLDLASSRICLSHGLSPETLLFMLLLVSLLIGNRLVNLLVNPCGPTNKKNPTKAIFNPCKKEFVEGSKRLICIYNATHSFAISAKKDNKKTSSIEIPSLLSPSGEKSRSKNTAKNAKIETWLETEIISINWTFFLMNGFLRTMKKS
ncbi:sacI homology domain-containing protein / WW domain-containing protein [Striga asiatica]|uniref:SacI homology domain-containing protein / WW domain-containing protein n=1 Tax=Striga asiatica TaxID=4170 RepID=A0A5A7Q040_STRAF|nr:sacI homology domain-containing protein / WW domain-containing protein [Striga asiatica]